VLDGLHDHWIARHGQVAGSKRYRELLAVLMYCSYHCGWIVPDMYTLTPFQRAFDVRPDTHKITPFEKQVIGLFA
jgi:hypothetical protein